MKTPLVKQTLLAMCLSLAALFRASGANDTWTGGGAPSGYWANPANWGGTAPSPGDALFFDTTTQTTTTNNFPSGTLFAGLTFNGTAGAFTHYGSNVFLSSAAGASIVGVVNNSGNAQTLNLPLTLDWGYFPVSSPGGGTLALNGSLTLDAGSLVYFDSTVSSASLTNDNSGLIGGLGGAGLTFNDGSTAFTGLATTSSGTVVPYSGFPSVISAPGAIGATTPAGAVNIELTGTAAGSYTFANGAGITYANTIFLSAASSATLVVGSTAGAQTLDLGAISGIGGFYLPAGVTAQALTVGSGAMTILTAGPETGPATPGTIVFAVNGTSTANQIENNSTITDNGSGGKVTLIKTGPGSMYSGATLTNTHSGGTYVQLGQLQANNVSTFGTGPIYIGANATILLNYGANTLTNNVFLSAGSGAPITGVGAANGAGSLEINQGDSFLGTFTLLGPPVTAPPGDRITGNDTGGTFNFNGQITGTGTLEFFGFHTYTAVLNNTSVANPNNWQGGMIIGGKPGVAVNVDVKMGATNQIPSGANAGNITFLPATAAVYARLDLNSLNQTVNGLVATSAFAQEAGAAGAELENFGAGSCTLTLGANNATATFNGVVADGGTAAKATSLNKIGAGTQTFGGAMNHFGSTTISAGTLALTGSATMSNTPSINVAPGATFDPSAIGGFTVAANQSLNCLGAVNGALTINGKLSALVTNIGTFNDGNEVTFNAGSTYVWDINNASGTAGGDPGWGLLNVTNGASLILNTPMTVKIVSLGTNDLPGAAINFNPNHNTNWTIMRCASGITVNPASVVLDTSSFSNAVGNGSFAIGVSVDGTRLILNFNSTPAITTPLANVTTNAGDTAVFTVIATNAANPLGYSWFDNNQNPLANGETTASGAFVTISTNVAAHSSTLILAGVEDSDVGLYTVIVTNDVGQSGVSSATLTVIDPPSNPTLTESGANLINAGGITYLTASADGTTPFTYLWFFNGVLISGATNATLAVDVSPSSVGSYVVVLTNPAGSVTNAPFVIGPVTSVPNQIIYEPFSSYAPQVFRPASDTWEGVTNLFDEATGQPAWWFHSSGSGIQMIVQLNDLNDGNNNLNGGSYPWPGLAGMSPNCLYWDESLNSHLEFQQSPFPTGTTVYVSFILSCVSLGGTDGIQDVLAGFVTENDGTAFNLKLCSQINDSSAGQYQLGIAKANGRTGSQGVDANTVWANPILEQQDVFVVCAYTVVSGGTVTNDDTVEMWLNPDPSTFYAATPPAPTLGPTSFGVENSIIRDFAVHSVNAPSSHRIADLRIGTTWASVTPPSAPTLSLANVTAYPDATASLPSQNAGNPVTTYSWQFNHGTPLNDNSHYAGSSTATLIISNVGPADVGAYTVTGINQDPLTSAFYTNSASATLLLAGPPLSLAYLAPNLTISWPTNAPGFTLENSSSLHPPLAWTTNSLPPYPVVGTNYSVTVNAASASKYYRLIH